MNGSSCSIHFLFFIFVSKRCDIYPTKEMISDLWLVVYLHLSIWTYTTDLVETADNNCIKKVRTNHTIH